MLKDIVIIGAGGVGSETALIIEDINNVNSLVWSYKAKSREYLLKMK